MYLPVQVFLLQVLLSSEFPTQLLPNMHLLRRVSVPWPHVTEQVHDPQSEPSYKERFISSDINILLKLSIFMTWHYASYNVIIG